MRVWLAAREDELCRARQCDVSVPPSFLSRTWSHLLSAAWVWRSICGECSRQTSYLWRGDYVTRRWTWHHDCAWPTRGVQGEEAAGGGLAWLA